MGVSDVVRTSATVLTADEEAVVGVSVVVQTKFVWNVETAQVDRGECPNGMATSSSRQLVDRLL